MDTYSPDHFRDLANNLMSGELPSALFSLTNLTALCAAAGQQGRPAALSAFLRAAQSRLLSENQFSGVLPAGIGNLVGLTVMCVHATSLPTLHQPPAAPCL